MNCCYCSNTCIKKGKQKSGVQKYYCRICNKYQQTNYCKNACDINTNKMIIKLLCNGSGIRDISRVLEISPTTVISRIKAISNLVVNHSYYIKRRTYEVDELKTFVRKKENEYWICCTLEKRSGRIMSLSVGKRTKKTLEKALVPVLLSEPKKIHSDRLKQYKSIIDSEIHNVKKYTINKVERKFLNFRTHLKRLCRRSICFSKSAFMLEAIVKIYVWSTYVKLPAIFQ